MTILVTGFEPFGQVTDNPSQRIVEYLAKRDGRGLAAHVLPVDYKSAGQKLLSLIERHNPSAILLLGVAQKRKMIALERIAININDARIPDNDGKLVQGQRIAAEGPVGYWSTLPLDAMVSALEGAEIPVKFSNHAGAYLCNHVMYVALDYLERTGSKAPCGFIHVPGVEFVPLAKQIDAIEMCLDVLGHHIPVI